ncbi:MAG: molybdenum cofactor guanylyltransferase [Salinivirgaceae bacterium]|jgi:molybdopterin-guanine dinucleotide biosynthesis protein A
MMLNKNANGIILAGGKSSRMGSNKAVMLYNNQRLIDISISIIAPLVSEVLVSSNDSIPNIKHRMVPDVFENIGPLGGLYSCLKESNNSINLVIPCDVPLVSTAFYELMLEKMGSFDAVIPCYADGRLEPLIGVYHKNVLSMLEEQIRRYDYKLVNLLERLNVFYIEIPESVNMKNLNYPTDLV